MASTVIFFSDFYDMSVKLLVFIVFNQVYNENPGY